MRYLNDKSIETFLKFIKSPDQFSTKVTKEDLILDLMGANTSIDPQNVQTEPNLVVKKPMTGLKRGASVPNLLNDKQFLAKFAQAQPSNITYKEINELSKNMFLEEFQRKWIERERKITGEKQHETPKRPTTMQSGSRNSTTAQSDPPFVNDLKTIQTTTNYWKQIGMYNNVKKARATIN